MRAARYTNPKIENEKLTSENEISFLVSAWIDEIKSCITNMRNLIFDAIFGKMKFGWLPNKRSRKFVDFHLYGELKINAKISKNRETERERQ